MYLPISTKGTFKFTKKGDRFNKVHDCDEESGPFCDMEDLEDNQDFDEYTLPDIYPPDAGKNSSYYEGNESIAEGGGKSNNYLSHTVHVDIP